jgi:L-asparaginase II
MTNPIIAEVTRGSLVESRHRGAYCVVDAAGHVVAAGGGIVAEIYPRSAIKAFQCLPLIESGAADQFGFIDEEIALACASHHGEPDHVRVARSMLKKAMNDEADYECGAHWPSNENARHALVHKGTACGQIHNNCSGKHAGMLALARQLGVDPKDYVMCDHPVQRAIAKAMGAICDCDLDAQPCGIDGCSVPTWAMPIQKLALGFSRLCAPDHKAGQHIIAAVRNVPFMVEGTGGFDTELMLAVPRVFVKGGAEGVHCGCIPHAGLGIALKCDDGAGRAAEVAMAGILASLDVWTSEEKAALLSFHRRDLHNRRNIKVGERRAASL